MTNIAIIGATGNVGRKTLEVIEKKDIKFDNLFLVASSNSAGKKISFKFWGIFYSIFILLQVSLDSIFYIADHYI